VTSKGRGRGNKGTQAPDILYHATDVELASRARQRGVLEIGGGRQVFMSRSESQAWLVAHRRKVEPMVLYIDVSRARRAGARFVRNGRGLWQTRAIPTEHVLNLRDGFGHQLSAGGLPVYMGPSGPEVALIQVVRRFGSTWEIAKGKLEPGEDPLSSAKREIQEEMGAEMPLELMTDLGAIRYGFTTPEGEPRLKTMFVYMFRTPERVAQFHPAQGESVTDVQWFTPKAAQRVVTHRSLRPIINRVRWMLDPT
jgi:8-oxo-dGTP pyrophosphatase MutT (NUDIX family)